MNDEIIKNNLDYTLFSWAKQGNLNPINASYAEGSSVYDRDGEAGCAGLPDRRCR